MNTGGSMSLILENHSNLEICELHIQGETLPQNIRWETSEEEIRHISLALFYWQNSILN